MSEIQFADRDTYFNASLLPRGVMHWSRAGRYKMHFVRIYGEVAATRFDWREYERNIGYPELGIEAPPTFLEIGEPYPSQAMLRVVIPGRDRERFPKPPDALYAGKAVIVEGMPYVEDKVAHVVVSSPESIRIVGPIEGLYAKRDSGCEEDANYQEVFQDHPLRARSGKGKPYYERSNPMYYLNRPYGVFRGDDGEEHYSYDGRSLPYDHGKIKYDGREYEVMDLSDAGGEIMYWDENNGWLTEIP